MLVQERIRVAQYADNVFLWNWTADGVPVDFTGCTAACTLRIAPDQPVALAITTTPNPNGSAIALGTPANALGPGLVQLTIARLDAATLTAAGRKYTADLLITMTNGQVMEFAALDVRVHAGSTY